MGEDIWTEIFRHIIGKPSKEELETYQEYYEDARKKRDLFCEAITYDNGKLEERACNYLFYLNLFKKNVPGRIRRKMPENFNGTESMAKDILQSYLSKLEKKQPD